MSRFQLPFQRAEDNNGHVLDGATLTFSVTGTSTPKNTFSDALLTIANANPVVADSQGQFGEIYLEVGSYRVELKDKNGVTQTGYPVDGVASPALVGPIPSTVIADLATLRLATVSNGEAILLQAHTTAGDGGGGHFRGVTGAAPGTYVDNNGTIIVPIGGDGSAALLREDIGYVTPQMFGAASGGADDNIAIQATIDSLTTGGEILLDRAYKSVGNLSIIVDDVTIRGVGNAASLEMNNGALTYNAVTKTTHLSGNHLSNLQVSRTGTVGPAIQTIGKNLMGVVRFTWDKVHILSSTGSGISMEGTWIFDLVSCVIQGCSGNAIDMVLAGDGLSSVNAGKIHGGELQGNTGFGISADGISGLSLYGVTIESCQSGGVNLQNNGRSVSFFGCYFELNDDPTAPSATNRDIICGDTTYAGTKTTGGNVSIIGCIFWQGSGGLADYAIELSRTIDCLIEGNRFNSYGVGGIHYLPELTNQVSGLYLTNGSDTVVTDALVNANFHSDKLEHELTASVVYDFPSIVSGATSTHSFPVIGAVSGDFASISTAISMQGMTVNVRAITDNVEVAIRNSTASAIDLANTTWRITVVPRALYGI